MRGLLLVGVLFGAIACQQTPAKAPAAVATTEVIYRVEGMTCEACSKRVTTAIQAIPGVLSADVKHAAGQALVRWSSPPDHAAVQAAVKAAGYSAQPLRGPGA